MKPISIVFFGSFLHYSVQILEILHPSPQIDIAAVITTPPQPAGRKQQLQKTPVHIYAQNNHLPIFTPEKLNQDSLKKFENWLLKIGDSTKKPSFFVVAGYSKLLPVSWLNFPKIAPLNLHFSLLPKFRGAMPAEWAILLGEKTTGVTTILMDPTLDTGDILEHKSAPIVSTDTRESLYHTLYHQGAQLCLHTLTHFSSIKPTPQPQTSPTPHARLLNKQDSFIPASVIFPALSGQNTPSNQLPPLLQQVSISTIPIPPTTLLLSRAIRALHGWPGIWTTVTTKKGAQRLKIHSAHLKQDKLFLDQVQLEGNQPTLFSHIQSHINFA